MSFHVWSHPYLVIKPDGKGIYLAAPRQGDAVEPTYRNYLRAVPSWYCRAQAANRRTPVGRLSFYRVNQGRCLQCQGTVAFGNMRHVGIFINNLVIKQVQSSTTRYPNLLLSTSHSETCEVFLQTLNNGEFGRWAYPVEIFLLVTRHVSRCPHI